LNGCGQRAAADKKITDIAAAVRAAVQEKTVAVIITDAEQKDVPLYIYAEGRTVPSNAVEVRARVAGYLEKLFFRSGAIVKEGDQLALIEQAQYQVALDAAKAELANRKAQLDLAEANLQRGKTLFESKTISSEEFQTHQANRDMAAASLDLAKSNVRNAELNLQYTDMKSPITGKTTKNLVDVGNYVSPGGTQSVILSVAQLDPMYVEFKLSDRQFTDLKDRIGFKEAFEKATAAGNTPLPAKVDKPLALANTPIGVSLMTGVNILDFDFNVSGQIIAIIDNQINVDTGQITLRGEVRNPLLDTDGSEDFMLYPGQICRVRIPLETVKDAVLIREEAILTDLDTKYVLVIGKGMYQPKNAMGEPLRYKIVTEKYEEKEKTGGEEKVVKSGVREKIVLIERGNEGTPVPEYETYTVRRKDIKLGQIVVIKDKDKNGKDIEIQRRIVKGGLAPGEQYIVKGVQRARVGMEVKPITLEEYDIQRAADLENKE
jgi:RND family efflux transporter MFP subunit